MKIFITNIILLKLIFIDSIATKNIDRRVRRSVFDMITKIHENVQTEQISYKNLAKSSTVISMVGEDDKSIKYQDLKTMFLTSKYEENQKSMKNQILKEGVKNHFKRKIKAKFMRKEKEHVLINLSFLTKL